MHVNVAVKMFKSPANILMTVIFSLYIEIISAAATAAAAATPSA